MTESTFLITTIVFAGTTLLSLGGLFSLWMGMKEEGRFFWKRGFDKKGIDVIRHEPLSNRLRLITVTWNGQYFQHGKEMIFFGIEKLINPKTDSKRYFNEIVGRMCTWAGSKRPVLIATDVMSHLLTPDLLALVAKSKNHEQYEKLKKDGKWKELQKLTSKEETAPDFVSYLETIKPDDLTEYMEDISSRDAMQVFETGKRITELNRAKGFELGGAAKVAISLAGIGMVLLLIYLASSGKFDTIIDTVKT